MVTRVDSMLIKFGEIFMCPESKDIAGSFSNIRPYLGPLNKRLHEEAVGT
jgi:hypothetical protein